MGVSHIFLDMDEVVVDFTGAALRLFPEFGITKVTQWDMPGQLGISSVEFWRRIDEVEDFWECLQPYPHAQDMYEALWKIAPVTFASSPSGSARAAAGKINWLNNHFGPGIHNFMLGQDKHLLAKPGHLLIDDREENVTLFRKHGGEAVLYPQVWNSNAEHIDNASAFTVASVYCHKQIKQEYNA
jgi:5'(3')-deoxyribonucleotidase